jgi:hypothetical protein
MFQACATRPASPAKSSLACKESLGALICVALILLLWIFQFAPKWVRIAADAYAERLAETSESVKRSSPSSKGQTNEKTA